MKRILSFILTIIMVLGAFTLTSCKDEKPEETIKTFTISADYAIIRPKNATDSEMAATTAIRTAISEAVGLDLLVLTDDDGEALEIIIGNSNRPTLDSAKEKAGELGYTIFASEKSIHIYGSSDEYLDLAVDAFIEKYVNKQESIVLPETLDVTHKHIFSQPDLKINGNDISKYKIVYASEGATTQTRSNGGFVESGKYEDVAIAVQEEIYLLTGHKLEISPAKTTAKSDFEIIVGNTNDRTEDDAFMPSNTDFGCFAYGASGTKLVFCGRSSNATYFAALKFVEFCEKMDGSDFTKGMTEGYKKLIKVACVGDSITNGSGKHADGTSNNCNVHSYPIYLQRLLGFEYYVGNYGYPGICMTNFESTALMEYRLSRSLSPDIVIIMLGTNDAQTKYETWGTEAGYEAFRAATRKLVGDYRAKNAKAEIYLMTPPSVLNNKTHLSRVTKAAELVRGLSAELGCHLIDMYTISGKGNWTFVDGVHPQDVVYSYMADAVYENLKLD